MSKNNTAWQTGTVTTSSALTRVTAAGATRVTAAGDTRVTSGVTVAVSKQPIIWTTN